MKADILKTMTEIENLKIETAELKYLEIKIQTSRTPTSLSLKKSLNIK